ncbi:helix-turn-helix domain-containing protein [Streptomyces sp. NBC_01207]|uniref:helix-turn-helix domain-containing protein n=1 Tax=Streptomyces sp. NBC_01207 TaxID=2903772 RepID=UPI002E164138|nr:helix-turn-helix domain-containing protein [Streptomyces sp. NBC_01207]
MSGSPTMPRLRGEERRKVATQMAREYDGGASIRGLVTVHGRSYGFTRVLVIEGGGRLRGRGGAQPKPRS